MTNNNRQDNQSLDVRLEEMFLLDSGIRNQILDSQTIDDIAKEIPRGDTEGSCRINAKTGELELLFGVQVESLGDMSSEWLLKNRPSELLERLRKETREKLRIWGQLGQLPYFQTTVEQLDGMLSRDKRLAILDAVENASNLSDLESRLEALFNCAT